MLVLLRWPMPAGGVQEGKALGARWDGQGEAEGRRRRAAVRGAC